MRLIITLIILSLIGACQIKQDSKTTMLNGSWESVGSGWILQIQDSTKYAMYDITTISCLPSRKGELHEISEYLRLQGDTLSYLLGVTTYKFTKAKKLPDLCSSVLDTKSVKDPLYNFEVFAETVKEHYAFLELNNINWEKLYKEQKDKLNKNSSDAELYLIIEETFEKLNDNHAFLDAPDEVYEAIDKLTEEEENAESNLPEHGDFPVADMVAKHYLQEDMTKDSWLIKWGKMTNDIGYVQLKAMWLYADLDIPKPLIDSVGWVDAFGITREKIYEGDYIKKEVEGVRKIMDRVMNDLAESESIVFDVRFNGGGQDVVSYEILSQFISGKLQIGTQKLRYGNQHTPVIPIYMEGTKEAYSKPVYVLTSPQTGSAAECFSMATLEMKNVKRIGSSTEGAMSTTLDKTLPNGWNFCVSNEVVMDKNGFVFENKGVPVDYELNYPTDRQTFFRSVVNDLDKDKENTLKAIKELKTNH